MLARRMSREEFEAKRASADDPLPYPRDWRVVQCFVIKDVIYRYRVVGENLNYEEGHPFRKFDWQVPDLSWRYFWE